MLTDHNIKLVKRCDIYIYINYTVPMFPISSYTFAAVPARELSD